MGAILKISNGDIVAIRFLDHAEDATDPIEFWVYGEIAKVTRKHYAIDSWAYADPKEKHDDNEKRFVIVRSAIQEIHKLVWYESNP